MNTENTDGKDSSCSSLPQQRLYPNLQKACEQITDDDSEDEEVNYSEDFGEELGSRSVLQQKSVSTNLIPSHSRSRSRSPLTPKHDKSASHRTVSPVDSEEHSEFSFQAILPYVWCEISKLLFSQLNLLILVVTLSIVLVWLKTGFDPDASGFHKGGDLSATSNRPLPFAVFQENEGPNIRRLYSDQLKPFWATLSACLKGVLNKTSPIRPCTLVLLHRASTGAGTVKSFAMHFTEAVERSYANSSRDLHVIGGTSSTSNVAQPLLIDGSIDYDKFSKKSIDEKIQNHFTTTKGHSCVVERALELPPDVAMLFHAYCDSENAPHKDALFVFLLSVPDELWKSNCQDADDVARNLLSNRWESALGQDKLSALLSRVLGFVTCFLDHQ